MILLIDIGNTRIKWATFDGHAMSPCHAEAHENWTSTDPIQRLLGSLAKPTRVLVANVAGERIAQLLSDSLYSLWSLTPEFIHSTKRAAGVLNGYQVPAQLGVDRWLGAIATHHSEKRAACIASVGTALTIDGVDAQGRHVGGAILPGPQLMLESLFRETSDIEERALSEPQCGGDAIFQSPSMFAGSTRLAVNNGITLALAAAVERAYSEFAAHTGTMPALVLTGGGASRIGSALGVPFKLVPDLVLRGLVELARDQLMCDRPT